MDAVIKQKDTVVVTQRNVDIISQYSNGIHISSIAKKHKLSVRSVEAVIAKLKDEFNCKSLPHLIATFFRKGLIK
jgi:DNA-binding CsgD family transcriptional regulator